MAELAPAPADPHHLNSVSECQRIVIIDEDAERVQSTESIVRFLGYAPAVAGFSDLEDVACKNGPGAHYIIGRSGTGV